MSGTSIDGVDFTYLETNGTNYVKIFFGKTYKYSNIYKTKIKNLIEKIQKKNSLSIKNNDLFISKQFLNYTKKFIKEYNINLTKIHYIGLSGQTIIHNPDKKISIQLGSGKFLSQKLKINVISNFRQNDILHGGQGAPIGAFYHKYLSTKIKKNIAFINLGGIANICFTNKKKLIAFDTGPANVLIDEFIWKKLKKNFDIYGILSSKGKLNYKILNEFLSDKYFIKNYPKSLDRNYFFRFLKKVNKLSNSDGLHTLSMLTVYGIKKGIDLLNEKIDQIVLTGGGRKNKFISNKLKEITKLQIINIDDLGFDGDLLESQAFAYLSVRSVKKLPLSIYSTTGVKKPVSGGILHKFKN